VAGATDPYFLTDALHRFRGLDRGGRAVLVGAGENVTPRKTQPEIVIGYDRRKENAKELYAYPSEALNYSRAP
jgi:hypothetical protein